MKFLLLIPIPLIAGLIMLISSCEKTIVPATNSNNQPFNYAVPIPTLGRNILAIGGIIVATGGPTMLAYLGARDLKQNMHPLASKKASKNRNLPRPEQKRGTGRRDFAYSDEPESQLDQKLFFTPQGATVSMPRFPEKDLFDSPAESLELEQPPEDVWARSLDETYDDNQDSPQTITPSPTTKPNSPRHSLYSSSDGLATLFSGSYKAFRAAQSSGLVRIIGGQGSGKSTFAAALIRDRILKGHRVIVFNDHIDYDTFKPLEIYGQGDTTEEQFQDISSGLKWFTEEREARYLTRRTKPRSEWLFMEQPITIVVEELGEYSGSVEPEIMQKFMKLLMIGIRKGNLYFIGISQGTTKTMFGGASGIKDVMEESIVDVHLLNQPDPNRPGGLGPKMSALVTVNGGEAVGVKLPDLTPMFPPGQLDKEEYDFTDLLPSGSPSPNWLNPTNNNVVPFVIA